MTRPNTRGVRNNNPLNIRIGNTWLGEVPNPTDSEFEQFVSITYGLRASFCILRRYINRYHRNTVEKIISTWAPSNENHTSLYIGYVCSKLNIEPNKVLEYSDTETMVKLVQAMAKFESACDLKTEVLMNAYKIA